MIERHEKLLIVSLVVLALAVQLPNVLAYGVGYDPAQVLYLAWDFVDKGIFPVHGILNSLGAYNPPFFVWLYLLPMMLTRDHGWVLTLPALSLYILAILILYRLGQRYFNPGLGLAAAALYAFSPRGLYFGHSSWAQGLLSPLYVLMVLFMSEWLLEHRSWYVALLLPLAAWMTGIHWGGALAFGVVMLAALFFRTRLHPIPIFVGVFISLLLWAPYLGFERERSFADILAVVRGPLPRPDPEEITSLCRQDTGQEEQSQGPIDRLKDSARSLGPGAYRVLKWIYQGPLGMIRVLSVNFHWSPSQPSPGSIQQKMVYFAGTASFLVGLGVLLYRLGIRRTASPAERLLLLSFLLPAMLQNLTPRGTMVRPDISWLFYGPQVLIIAYALTLPCWAKARVVQVAVWVTVGLLIVPSVYKVWEWPVAPALRGEGCLQCRMAAWIAEDLTALGRKEASIRYDYLRESPEQCWKASFATLGDTYYFGAEHDYLLLTLYGIRNTSKTPDGWAADPDYIVVIPEGLHRYDQDRERYQVVEFGQLIVLKASVDFQR